LNKLKQRWLVKGAALTEWWPVQKIVVAAAFLSFTGMVAVS